MNLNCSNLLDMRNLQEQVKKAFCYQKLFWPFTVWINWSSDLKNFTNSRPLASNFNSFSRSLEQFFLTVGQNNFYNKIPFLLLQGKNPCQFQRLQRILHSQHWATWPWPQRNWTGRAGDARNSGIKVKTVISFSSK